MSDHAASQSPYRWSLRLFGSLRVDACGAPLSARVAKKEQWLLALMALRNGQTVEREKLAGLLWPDNEKDLALYNLRRALSNLRDALGEEAFRLQAVPPRSLDLDLAESFVDVLEFDRLIERGDPESLREAVELRCAPLLEDCYEVWAAEERLPRERTFCHALETLAVDALNQRQGAEAARLARRLITADPLQESAYRLLMQALAAEGSPAAAIQTYRDLRVKFREELNADPAPETQALYEQIREASRQGTTTPKREIPTGTKSVSPVSSTRSLPMPLTRLVGREAEIDQLQEVLGVRRDSAKRRDGGVLGSQRGNEGNEETAGTSTHFPISPFPSPFPNTRLVTLVGAGGIGKTRLAIEAARQAAENDPDGAVFVELAAMSDPGLVPNAVALALEIREETGVPMTTSLCRSLATRRLLLVLDNCEHLLQDCAVLANTLLTTCPHLTILATSRQPLGLPGETVWRVPSLPVPPTRDDATDVSRAKQDASEMLEYPSVQLFLERARQFNAEFRLSPAQLSSLAQICRRLDGIPLAIELAAARVKVLHVDQIAARLNDRFRLLIGGNPAALPRQQTLRAMVDWSYDLLEDEEKRLLARLSVFTGGFTLEATEAVASEKDEGGRMKDEVIRIHPSSFILHPSEVLDLLSSLIDKSLVVPEQAGEEVRYRMLETIRQYARERLTAFGETDDVSRRHRDYFNLLVQEARPKLNGPEQAWWLDRLEAEHDNIRAALAFSEIDPEGGLPGLELAGKVSHFWQVRGHVREGRERVRKALAHPGAQEPTLVRAGTLNEAGILADIQGDDDGACDYLRECLAIRRAVGSPADVAACLNNLGNIVMKSGDLDGAQKLYEEALECARTSGHLHFQSNILTNLGIVAEKQGCYEESLPFYEAGLRMKRELGNAHGVMISLINLSSLHYRLGQYDRMREILTECLGLCRETGEKRCLIYAMEQDAMLAYQTGEYERSAHLFGQTTRLREIYAYAADAHDTGKVAEAQERLRAAIGEEAFDTAFAAGDASVAA